MSQAPKPPNPFDPYEEEVAKMVSEGGREPLIVEVPTVLSRIENILKLENTVDTALETFQKLDKGEAAPSVVVTTDGNHISASWTTPTKKGP